MYKTGGDDEDEDELNIAGNNSNGSKSPSGLWITGVGEYRASPFLHLLGRIGIDLGDDNGLIYGFGIAVNLDKFLHVRGEIVERDNISSIQLNVISEFQKVPA